MQTPADILATPPMPVIITRLVPLNGGGYEIRAECEFTRPQFRFDHDWNDALDVDGNHAEAALALLEKVYGTAHPFKLVMGRRTDDVMVFVQVAVSDKEQVLVNNLEYAVDDCSGQERIFKTPDAAAGFAVSIAMSGRENVYIDVLCWDREAAVAYQGEEFAEQVYDMDPEASVTDRIVVKAESIGRVA